MANKWCKEKLPIGAIRVRTRRGTAFRYIKVSNRGQGDRKWRRLARWTWEQAHGPVPAGYVVAHLDGNSLNDDPANYGLMTPGQVAQLQHQLDPKMSTRNRQKVSQVTAERNRLAGQIRRRTFCFAAEYWYLVDDRTREILDRRFRSRRRAYAWLGIVVSLNGHGRVESPIKACRGRTIANLDQSDYRVVDHFSRRPERPKVQQ